jgi:phosphoglycolate phosphatase
MKHTFLDAVIVDLDGTMVDTLADFVAALNLMLLDLGLGPVDRQAVAPMIGKGSEHLIQTVLAHVASADAAAAVKKGAAGPVESTARTLFPFAWARYQHHYLAINGQHARVYPGVFEGLERIKSHGLPMACLTNKPLAFAQQLLKLKGLDGYFSQVFGGDSFALKKPDPLPLLKTCEALSRTPARTLMLGDSSNDARAARAAGCPVVLVTYGYNHGQPIRAVDADGFVDSFVELALRPA